MWWIDIDDAVRIYARMLRARLGSRRGAKAALETADHLRAKGDWSGVEAWEAVAAELRGPPKWIEGDPSQARRQHQNVAETLAEFSRAELIFNRKRPRPDQAG